MSVEVEKQWATSESAHKRDAAKRRLANAGILAGLSVATLVVVLERQYSGIGGNLILTGLLVSSIPLIGASILFMLEMDILSSVHAIPEPVVSRWPWLTRKSTERFLKRCIEVFGTAQRASTWGSNLMIMGMTSFLLAICGIAFSHSPVAGAISVVLVALILGGYCSIWVRYMRTQVGVVERTLLHFMEDNNGIFCSRILEDLSKPKVIEGIESENPELLRQYFGGIIQCQEDAEAIEKEYPSLVPLLRSLGLDSKTLEKARPA